MKTKREDALNTSKKRKSEPEAELEVAKKKSDAPSLSKKRSSSIRRFFMSRSRRKDARTDNEHDHKQLVTEEEKNIMEDDTDRCLENDEERLFKLIKAFQECDDDSESFEEHESTSQADSRREPDEDFNDLAAQVEAFRKQIADRLTPEADASDVCVDDKKPPLSVSSPPHGSNRVSQNSSRGETTAEKDFNQSQIQSNQVAPDQLIPSQLEITQRSSESELIRPQKSSRGSRSSNLRHNKFKRDARQLKVDSIDEEKLTEVKQDRREDGIPHAHDTESEKHIEQSEHIEPKRSNRRVRSSNLRNNKFKRDARKLTVDSIESDEDNLQNEKPQKSDDQTVLGEQIQPKRSNRSVTLRTNLRKNKFKKDARQLLMSDDIVKEKTSEEEIEYAPKPTVSNRALSQGTGPSQSQSALANSTMFAARNSHPKTEPEIKETVKALRAKSERNGFKDIADEIENSIAAKNPKLDEHHSFHESKELTDSDRPHVDTNHDHQLVQDRFSDNNQDEVDSELEGSYQAKCSEVNPANKHDLSTSDSAHQTKSFEHTEADYVDETSHRGDPLAEDLTTCQYEDSGYEIDKTGSFLDLDTTISAGSMHQQYDSVHNSISNKSIQQSIALATPAKDKSLAAPAKPPRKLKINRVPSEDLEAMMQSLMATEATLLNRKETEASQRQEPEENGVEFARKQKLQLQANLQAKPPRKPKVNRQPSEDLEAMMQSLMATEATLLNRKETEASKRQEPEENGVDFARKQKLEPQANPPAKPPRKQKIDRVPSEDPHVIMQSLLAIEENFLKGAETETQQPENRFEERLNFPKIPAQPPPPTVKTTATKQEKQTSDYALEISPGSSSHEYNVNTEKTDEETEKTDTEDSKKRGRCRHIMTILLILMLLGAVTYVSVQ